MQLKPIFCNVFGGNWALGQTLFPVIMTFVDRTIDTNHIDPGLARKHIPVCELFVMTRFAMYSSNDMPRFMI